MGLNQNSTWLSHTCLFNSNRWRQNRCTTSNFLTYYFIFLSKHQRIENIKKNGRIVTNMSLKGWESKRNFLLDINHKTYSDNTKLWVKYIATLLIPSYWSTNLIFINNLDHHLVLCTKSVLSSTTCASYFDAIFFNSVLILRR